MADLLRRVVRAGAAFRWNGAHLELVNSARLDGATRRAVIAEWRHLYEHLEDQETLQGLTETMGMLDVEVEEVDDADRAREVIAGLPDTIGLDIETYVPGSEPPLLRITSKGALHPQQPRPQGEDGLSPFRAAVRLVQVFDHESRSAHVLDMLHVPWEAIEGLWGRHLLVHNAAFELRFLGYRGIWPRRVLCSAQLTGLALGVREARKLRPPTVGKNYWPRRSLAAAAERTLGIPMDKSLQTSHWAAPRLSRAQIIYAALDAVLVSSITSPMIDAIGELGRYAIEIQNEAVPVAAKLYLRGIPFDPEVHRETCRGWAAEFAEARARFRSLTGDDPPIAPLHQASWLEARLPREELVGWPRTKTGVLTVRRDVLEARAVAAHPEVRPLLDVAFLHKRLSTFGDKLMERVEPSTRRIHADLNVGGADTGRFTCSTPNLQQLPPDVRRAVVAPEGRVLVCADYGSMELRVIAELAGDDAMREAFEQGVDIHALTASRIAGVALEEVTPEQRRAAKPINFGCIYCQQPRGLAANAWTSYRVEMSESEARAALEAFFAAYPAIQAWHGRVWSRVADEGVLRTVAGRPIRHAWIGGRREGDGIWKQKAANFPVQGSAADVMLVAMARLERALEGLPAQQILSVHDEILVECAKHADARVAAIVENEMKAAFTELFPAAPINGLVEAKVVRCWAVAKA